MAITHGLASARSFTCHMVAAGSARRLHRDHRSPLAAQIIILVLG
jgi:hypothetical protein